MSADINKHVEGLWVVTSIHRYNGLADMEEYKGKSRVATTLQGLKLAIRSAWDYKSTLRVEVEEYNVGPVFTYEAEKPEKK